MSDSSSWLQAATGHAAQRGRTLCVCVIAGLVALACGAPARAQQADLSQASLEELSNIRVYSASRFEQSTEDAPSSVTVVTADEIERHGYRTLADVLNSVRGFYVNYDRNYSYVGVRGFAPAGDYNTRILLMVDGHRLNDNIYDQGLIGTDLPISLDLVDRIEIVRGPNSSLYGTNAFLATVDIITKRGSQVDGLEVSTSAGSFGTYFGRATFGKKIGETEFLVSGDGYGSRGQDLFYREYDSPLTNAGWARRADDDSYHQFFLQARYRGVSLQALYGTREKGIPTGAFDTAFNDPRNRTVDERRYITLGYERSFAREWRLESSLFLDEYSYAGTYVIPTETGPGIAEPDWSRGQWWGADLRVSRPVGEKHRIFFGTEFRDNFQQDQGNYLLDPLLVFLDDHRSSSIVGVYGQAEITLRHDLRLNLGFRNDHYSTFGNTTNPRAALVYRPSTRTTVKLLYGTAFRAPNAYELYYHGDFGVYYWAANPNLRPEKIRTAEGILERALARSLLFSLSVYHNRISNLIAQTVDPPTGGLVFQNMNRAKATGAEAELSGRPWHGRFDWGLSYGYTDATDGEGGALANSPRHVAKLKATVPLRPRWLSAGIDAMYLSRRVSVSGPEVGGFGLLNLTLLARRLGRRVDISGSLYNLLDKHYGDPAAQEHRQVAIPQDGRSFRVKLTLHF